MTDRELGDDSSAVPYEPQSKQWPSDRALLLVHGVGNAGPGDYRLLLDRVRGVLGESASKTAIYQLFYDPINDWFTAKTELDERIDGMMRTVHEGLGDSPLAGMIAEFIGDVLWPVLSQAARTSIRESYLAQLKQMVLDGIESGHRPKRQNISIVCHSLGCFHTYEALHAAAAFPTHGLQPATHGVRFQNVVFMASPVQLIRAAAQRLSGLVPGRWMATLNPDGLTRPYEESFGRKVYSVDNWVSITGTLDPIGGYFMRKRAQWAYMVVSGQNSIVDPQDGLVENDEELRTIYAKSIQKNKPPEIDDKNPHSWVGYVVRHSPQLREWLAS